MRETCESCGKQQASFRFTEVDGEGRRTSLLCAECGVDRGIPRDELAVGRLDTREIWDEIVQRLAGKERESQDLACPDCGLTYAAFELHGSLGCPGCYQTFQGDITRMLREYHGGEEHRGKMPRLHGRRIDLRRRMLGVKEKIQIAVSEERFEDAARMRDEMRDLERELARLQLGEAGS
jgi:protein arginine kinase activator